MIEDVETAEVQGPAEPPLDRPAAAPTEADRAPEDPVTKPATPAAGPKKTPRAWSMPKARPTRKQADQVGRIAVTFLARLVECVRSVTKACWSIVTSGYRIIGELPPQVRLLGVLGLSALLSVVGSVILDDALGTACAIALVPAFSLGFGVVAHRRYGGVGEERGPGGDVQNVVHSRQDLERSIEYVDGKLAFALNGFGTERHQQAMIALIQAKTATELSLGDAQRCGAQPRPRIRDGGTATTARLESGSAARRP